MGRLVGSAGTGTDFGGQRCHLGNLGRGKAGQTWDTLQVCTCPRSRSGTNSAPHGCRRQIRATGGGERAPSGCQIRARRAGILSVALGESIRVAAAGFRGSTWEWRHSFAIITCPGPPPRLSEWLKSRCPGASQRMFEWLKPRCPGPHATLLLCLISDIRTQRNAEPPLPSPCSGHPLPRHPSSFGFPSGIIR